MTTPVDKYSDAKIYKLCHIITDTKIIDGVTYKSEIQKPDSKIYIGSTCGKLNQRLWHHTHAFNNKETQTQCASSKLYEISKDVSIQLIEDFPCKTKEELNIRERYWIETTSNCINRNIPGQTWKERWEKNKDHNSEKHKEWLQANKEAIAAQRATPEHLAHERELRKKRMEDPEVRANNNAKRNTIMICPQCPLTFTKRNLSAHIKSIHIIE